MPPSAIIICRHDDTRLPLTILIGYLFHDAYIFCLIRYDVYFLRQIYYCSPADITTITLLRHYYHIASTLPSSFSLINRRVDATLLLSTNIAIRHSTATVATLRRLIDILAASLTYIDAGPREGVRLP